MCCRYWVDQSPELRPFVEEMNRSPLLERFERMPVSEGEVRPTDVVPVVAVNRRGERAVFPMKWGFSGRTLLINARAETAADKPTFRESWRQRRCAVPSAGYFEWEHGRLPDGRKQTGAKYRIFARDSAVTWMCGLYRIEDGIPTFVILTREPNDEIRFIHDRMPLIIRARDVAAWIRPDTPPEAILEAARPEVGQERLALI